MASAQVGRLDNDFKKPNPARPLRPVPEIVGKLYSQGPEVKQVLKISDEYLQERPNPSTPATVGPVNSIREAILRLSLFPNVVNKVGYKKEALGAFQGGGNI
jgi:hypothetical protein